jgi:hypothetical protein
MKRVRLDERQDSSINYRPQRLHQVKHERWPGRIIWVKETNRRIVPFCHDVRPYLTFKNSVGVVQYRVDRMGGISVLPNFIPSGGPWSNLMPVIWNWAAANALPLQRQ